MKKLVAIVAGMGLTAALAHAGEGLPKFEELDADQDGQITAAEAKVDEQLSELFESIDVDQNGALSADEYQQAAEPKKM